MVTPRSKMQTKPTQSYSKKNVKKSVCAITKPTRSYSGKNVKKSVLAITKPTRSYSEKNVKKSVRAIIRRSDRLRNGTPPAEKQEIENVVEEINLCESEKEDEPHVDENPLESMPPEESLEEKGDYFKAAKRQFQSDNPRADLKYKRLYFDSQKKIEALTKENYELSKNLEIALGKMEANGEVIRVCSDLVGKLKELLLIFNLAKATETALNLSSQAVLCRCSPPSDTGDPKAAVKRKKNAPNK